MAESAKKVEDMTSFLMKGMSAKADVKNVMNVVSVSKITGVFTTFFGKIIRAQKLDYHKSYFDTSFRII